MCRLDCDRQPVKFSPARNDEGEGNSSAVARYWRRNPYDATAPPSLVIGSADHPTCDPLAPETDNACCVIRRR